MMDRKIIVLIIAIIGLLMGLLPTNTFALVIQKNIISGIIWEDDNNNVQKIFEDNFQRVGIYIQSIATEEIFKTKTIGSDRLTLLDLDHKLVKEKIGDYFHE